MSNKVQMESQRGAVDFGMQQTAAFMPLPLSFVLVKVHRKCLLNHQMRKRILWAAYFSLIVSSVNRLKRTHIRQTRTGYMKNINTLEILDV